MDLRVHHQLCSNTNTVFLRNIYQFGVSEAGETMAKGRGSSSVKISQGKGILKSTCVYLSLF